MTQHFILRNQQGLYLNRRREWVEPSEAPAFYKTQNRDEAINEMVEVNSKDIAQRIQIVECELNHRGDPVIVQSSLDFVS